MLKILQHKTFWKQKKFYIFFSCVSILLIQTARTNASSQAVVQKTLHAVVIRRFAYTNIPISKILNDIFELYNTKHPNLKKFRIAFHSIDGKMHADSTTKISISMHDIPADVAFKYVLWQAGMKYDIRGHTIFIY